MGRGNLPFSRICRLWEGSGVRVSNSLQWLHSTAGRAGQQRSLRGHVRAAFLCVRFPGGGRQGLPVGCSLGLSRCQVVFLRGCWCFGGRFWQIGAGFSGIFPGRAGSAVGAGLVFSRGGLPAGPMAAEAGFTREVLSSRHPAGRWPGPVAAGCLHRVGQSIAALRAALCDFRALLVYRFGCPRCGVWPGLWLGHFTAALAGASRFHAGAIPLGRKPPGPPASGRGPVGGTGACLAPARFAWPGGRGGVVVRLRREGVLLFFLGRRGGLFKVFRGFFFFLVPLHGLVCLDVLFRSGFDIGKILL